MARTVKFAIHTQPVGVRVLNFPADVTARKVVEDFEGEYGGEYSPVTSFFHDLMHGSDDLVVDIVVTDDETGQTDTDVWEPGER
ncbi:MAG: hypothetical protein ACOC9R_01350 [bacterium]